MSQVNTPAATLEHADNQGEPDWLVRAFNLFKTKFAQCMQQLQNLKPTNQFLQLLEVGKNHNEHLLRMQIERDGINDVDVGLSLERTPDQRNEVMFIPYKNLGKMVGKFITEEITGMPKFGGAEKPEKYREKCGDYVEAVMKARYKMVKPSLTDYHKYYVKRQITAKKSDVRKKKKSEAEGVLLKNLQSQQQATPSTRLIDAAISPATAPITAISSVPANVSLYDSNGTPKRGWHASEELFTPDTIKRRRIDEEEEAPEFSLPSNNSESSPDVHLEHVPFDNTHEVPETDVGYAPNPITTQLLQIVPSATLQHPANNQIAYVKKDHNELMENAFAKVEQECGEDLKLLKRNTAGGSNVNQLGLTIQACQNGLRIELDHQTKFEPYRRIVKTFMKWVSENTIERDYNLSEIRADAGKRGQEYENIEASTELLVSKTVEIKMRLFQDRKVVVWPFLTCDDKRELDESLQKIRAQLLIGESRKAFKQLFRALYEEKSEQRPQDNDMDVLPKGLGDIVPYLNWFS